MTARQMLIDAGYEDTVILENSSFDRTDGSDTALIGVSEDGRATYSYDKMAEIMVANGDAEDVAEAAEFIDFNVIRSLPYVTGAPIIMHTLV